MRNLGFRLCTLFLVAAWFLVAPARASAECRKVGEACQGECPNLFDEGGTQIAGTCKMVGSGCKCEYLKSVSTCKEDKGGCRGTCPKLYKMREKKGPVSGRCGTASPCACFYHL